MHAPTREEARHKLLAALAETTIAGLECNLEYLRQLIASPVFAAGNVTCQYLNGAFHYRPLTVDVVDGGAVTTVQDYPGRIGHWAAGVSPRYFCFKKKQTSFCIATIRVQPHEESLRLDR